MGVGVAQPDSPPPSAHWAICPASRRWRMSRTAPSYPGTSTIVPAVCAVR